MSGDQGVDIALKEVGESIMLNLPGESKLSVDIKGEGSFFRISRYIPDVDLLP